jgi:RimJ/RimL family protein N-acetyltransferase
MMHDGAAPAEEFRPAEDEQLWYVLVKRGDQVLGLFLLAPHTNVCYEAHMMLLPEGRLGRRSIAAYEFGMDWVREHLDCKKIIGNIPDYNEAALRMALASGYRIIGTNTRSLRHNGRLIDQTIVGREL